MRRVWRGFGIAILVLGAAAVLAVGTAYARSARRLHRTHSVALTIPRAIPTDREAVERGAHLATITNCVLCHGADLGGAVYSDDALLGTIAGPNLTRGRGGLGTTFTDADWVRAIRHGVRRDGTSLVVMPSEVYVRLSEPDLAAIIAYLERLPPVDRVVPPTRFGPLGRALLAAGKLNILVAEKTPTLPLAPGVPPGPTAVYGRYLADVTGCHGCHGFGLSGGRVAGPPGLPPAANLTPAGSMSSWTEADFVRALRQGRRPDGSAINEFMPWRSFAHMTDGELRALWLYLRSAPPKPFGHK
jgi:mono/diheme cytochrome c family protein